MFTISISLFTNNLVTLHCYKTRDPFCFHSETFNHTNFLYTTVMYSKDELLSKDISELEDIAKNIGVQFNTTDNQEDIVYTILDKQAEVEGNKNPLGTKRKRVRIAKKDTDKVYTVKGTDGENAFAQTATVFSNGQVVRITDNNGFEVKFELAPKTVGTQFTQSLGSGIPKFNQNANINLHLGSKTNFS